MSEKVKKSYHRGRRKKKKGRIWSTIVLVIATGVFIFSALKLYGIFAEYKEGKDEYKKIQELAVTQKDKGKEPGKLTVDFDALKAINPDLKAWLHFDEPSGISYPVVQGKDNEEYLTRTFEANENKLGTLFIDVDNEWDFSDKNTFIYGHNMKNGTMFAQLMKYQKKAFYKENPYFYVYLPNGKIDKYQIFSAGVVKDTSQSYTKVYESEEAYVEYLKTVKMVSAYDTGVEVDAQSQVVSLSTCTNVREEERFLIHGVKVGEEDR